jgi:hypothetical protein
MAIARATTPTHSPRQAINHLASLFFPCREKRLLQGVMSGRASKLTFVPGASGVQTHTDRLEQATAARRAKLHAALRGLLADGRTDLLAGLDLLGHSPSPANWIVLLSDGVHGRRRSTPPHGGWATPCRWAVG